MKIFGTIKEDDFILKNGENFTEIYNNDEFQSKLFENSIQRSTWDNSKNGVNSKLSKKSITRNLKEISLYNPNTSIADNFKDGNHSKYLLVKAQSNGDLCIENRIPDQFSKVVVDLNTIEEYSLPEMFIIDYDTIFGVRLTSFIKYDNKFFTCDERVFFETLLIKYKSFSFRPFYWSKEKIWDEIGIKKDRAKKIIKKLIELEFISTEVRPSVIDNMPRQVTYFHLNGLKIIESLPNMFSDKHYPEMSVIEADVRKYLNIKKLENKAVLK